MASHCFWTKLKKGFLSPKIGAVQVTLFGKSKMHFGITSGYQLQKYNKDAGHTMGRGRQKEGARQLCKFALRMCCCCYS